MRTITEIPVADHAAAGAMVSSVMTQSGYKLKQRGGQEVWQCGNGFLTAPKFFRFYPSGDKLVIESWIKTALLPFVYVGESGLDNAMGFAIKPAMRTLLLYLINQLIVPGGTVNGYLPKK